MTCPIDLRRLYRDKRVIPRWCRRFNVGRVGACRHLPRPKNYVPMIPDGGRGCRNWLRARFQLVKCQQSVRKCRWWAGETVHTAAVMTMIGQTRKFSGDIWIADVSDPQWAFKSPTIPCDVSGMALLSFIPRSLTTLNAEVRLCWIT
jgi:hypothetical protein